MPTTYSQTITNPGAESGFTGWTAVSGSPSSTTSQHHTGAASFRNGSDINSASFSQTLAISGAALLTAIDHGQVSTSFAAFLLTKGGTGGGFPGSGNLYLNFYSSEGYFLGTGTGATNTSLDVWTQETLSVVVPSGTRSVTIGANSPSNSANTYWDDFTLDLIDSGTPSLAAQAKAEQVVAYGLVSQPAAQLRVSQTPVLAMGAAQTSSGNYHVKTHQVVAYALVRGKVDSVNLRAWTFLQDDHLFYGLQLGNTSTIVYDTTTQQWGQWYSPGYNYWRAEDVTDWEGFNLACDTENGTIWKIDPTGRLDAGTTPITSQVTGQATIRGRKTVPCYMAEMACSQAAPATTGSSIQLRTSDDSGSTWIDHGTIAGNALGVETLFRWSGLGLMDAPGRIFELTNVGYARRIDGVDLEVGK